MSDEHELIELNNIENMQIIHFESIRSVCVPFFIYMIHIWGIHHDYQQQLNGGLVYILYL